MDGTVEMSTKEIDRFAVLKQVQTCLPSDRV